MKKIILYSLAIGMLSLGFTACNDDEDQLTDTRVTTFAQLTLLGDNIVKLNLGDAFTEPGYVATEGENDITSRVVVTGNVDTSRLGFNNLNYSVANVDGFSVSAERLVMVKDPDHFASAYLGESQYGTRHYYNAPIMITDRGGGDFFISDILGGFYAYGRYPQYLGTLDFLLEAIIHLNDDNSIDVVEFGNWYWGDDVPELLNGSYNPQTGTIVLNMDFGAAFTVTLTK